MKSHRGNLLACLFEQNRTRATFLAKFQANSKQIFKGGVVVCVEVSRGPDVMDVTSQLFNFPAKLCTRFCHFSSGVTEEEQMLVSLCPVEEFYTSVTK